MFASRELFVGSTLLNRLGTSVFVPLANVVELLFSGCVPGLLKLLPMLFWPSARGVLTLV